MTRYANGQVPFNVLVHIEGDIWLPPATAQRFYAFRADVKAETGVTLYITGPSARGWDGWNGYRPLSAQIIYKKYLGIWAATAGTSSHGGTYRGRDCFAMDIGNWASVPWATFKRLAEKNGLTVNFVTPEERWHVGDFNPWSAPAGGGGSTPSIPNDTDEDDEMYAVIMNGNQYGLAKQFITHYSDSRQAKLGKEITGGNKLHQFGNGNGQSAEFANFMALFDALGIPRNAIDGTGKVLNPQNGKYEANGTWSREREILAKLK